MNRLWVPFLGFLCLLPAGGRPAALPLSGTGASTPANGVVVEQVDAGFAADRVGLQPGDVLLRWERAATPPANPEPAIGELSSPFDLGEVELEQATRGRLTLVGKRQSERLRVALPAGKWRLTTRPQLTREELEIYQKAAALIDAQEIAQGTHLWREMAYGFRARGDHSRAGWLFFKVAAIASKSLDWSTADGAFEKARQEAEAASEASMLLTIISSQAKSFHDRRDFNQASTTYRQALRIRQARSSQSLGIAGTLNHLGLVAYSRRDMAAAEDYYRRAGVMREEIAPQSLDVAASLNNLGNVAWFQGDMALAEEFYLRSKAIKEERGEQGMSMSFSLGNLGLVASRRGDLAVAESYIRRSLAIKERYAPEGLRVAADFNSLAAVLLRQGNLAAAEDYYRRALAIREKRAPESLRVASALNNLGIVASSRNDQIAAEELFQRSLVIREKVAPQSLDVAHSLGNLGEVAFARENLVAAEDYFRSALALYEQHAPQSIDTADLLLLGGDIAMARSDMDSAEAYYMRSLAIRRDRAPGTTLEAESCRQLAILHRRRKQLDPTLSFYNCAVEALEAQKGKLGGSDEVRSGFGAKYAGIYRQAIDFLVEVEKTEEAFLLLERYRARELLAMLAGRDLVFSSDLPAELEKRRHIANQRYDRAFGRWMHLSDQADNAERQAAREELETTRRRQDEIRAEIRAASPRLAALQDPRPLDLAATRAALDPGTLLLSYSIGEDRSHLFAVGPGSESLQRPAHPPGLRVIPLAVGEASLRAQVARFREALGRGRSDRRPEKVLLQARQLSELLLAPVTAQIGHAERLLILADGPLHSLPFAALTDPGALDGRRFLVETKPVHLAASATVFALLKQERYEPRATRLTAFGDPLYPAITPRDQDEATQLRAVLRSGFDLTPLPATRDEVEGLRKLHPQASRVYLGAEATEGRVKTVGPETTHLHIASHGLLDDRFPLDSALVFSIPERWREGEDNGLLQAWEIFEQVRIDADLVTLSACDTGLGKVLGGEGLQGLTRAFQYAGARSVLASLWSVSDTSTGELMMRFYGYLKEGQSKADALRGAQLDLLRDPALSHPFHWAGFELVGDWR